MKKRATRLVASGLALCCLLTGCAGDLSVPSGQVEVAAPRPVGVQDPAVIPTGAPTGSAACDPRASLRPVGALAVAGRMPAGSTMARIVKRGRLVVGVGQNNYRFGYRQPSTGELVGFEIDLAREIARAILGDPNKVQFLSITTAAREKAVQEGTVDMVIRSMTMTCDRWQRVAFSTEYFSAGQAILVNKGSKIKGRKDLAGQKLCAAVGSTSIRNIAAQVPQAKPVAAADALDCLVMLQQGQVAAVSTDDAILAGFAAQDPSTIILPDRFTEEPYGIAMKKESTDLVRFVNGVLERLRADGTWTRLYEQWLAALGRTPQPPAARYQG